MTTSKYTKKGYINTFIVYPIKIFQLFHILGPVMSVELQKNSNF